MKKWFTLLLIIALMLSVVAPASAAVTGEWTDPTLEIKGLKGTEADIKDQVANLVKMEVKGEIVDFSTFGSTDTGTAGHRICYEYNMDLEDTVLLKQDNERNPSHTEYITYKMTKNIAGFELLTQCCAGLGDPLEDLSIFISKTGKDGWVQVKTQATYYEFDPNIYLKWDKAYWFKSTLTNAQAIPTGYKYLKIQFNPCNNQGDATWNVAVDSVKIIMGSNVAPVTIPEDKKFVNWETINAEREATKTNAGSNTTTAAGGKDATTTAGGKNTTTQAGGKDTTTLAGGKNTTTTATNAKGEVITDASTTTSINADGEVITDPTTTATNENGEVITDPTNTGDADNTIGAEDGNKDTDTNVSDPVKKGSALPWIIGGVVVLAGAAVAFILIRKKQA